MKTETLIVEMSKAMEEAIGNVVGRVKDVWQELEETKKFINDNNDRLSKALGEIAERIENIKEYDDSDIVDTLNDMSSDLVNGLKEAESKVDEKLSAYDAKFLDLIEDFQGRQETLFDSVSKRITYEIKAPVNFDGKPLDAGVFVKWDNALWFNKLDGNDSIPKEGNHSYDLIIEAPRSPEHKGLYKEDEYYMKSDIVMKDNSSWMAVKNDPGELPGEGWRLLAKGMRGKKGEKGDSGDIVKVKFEAEKSIEELNDRLMILEASNAKTDS